MSKCTGGGGSRHGGLDAIRNGQTHFDGCWREHHACAVAEIVRLQGEVSQLHRALAQENARINALCSVVYVAEDCPKLLAVADADEPVPMPTVLTFHALVSRAEAAEAALAAEWNNALEGARREALCVRCAGIVQGLKRRQP